MASHYPEDTVRRPRPLRSALIIAGLAFLAGLALMAWALTQWEPAMRLVAGAEPAPVAAPATVKSPGAIPVPVASAPTAGQPIAAATAIDGRVAELEERMARIDLRAAAAAGNAARAEGLLIAFAARRAVDRGVALGYIEGELRERFGQTQPRAVAAIIGAAQNPVTLEALQSELEKLRPSLIGAGANEGWWDATRRTLGSLIVVRREGSTSPAPDQRLMRAQLRLESGQVDGALAEIARLPGRANAAGWMNQARRYIEAHRALDILEAAALTEGDTPIATPAPAAAAPTPGTL